jgi:hypothetical protein
MWYSSSSLIFCLLLAGYLLVLSCYPEDGGSMLLQNANVLLLEYRITF